jgi:hypothetical protein
MVRIATKKKSTVTIIFGTEGVYSTLLYAVVYTQWSLHMCQPISSKHIALLNKRTDLWSENTAEEICAS